MTATGTAFLTSQVTGEKLSDKSFRSLFEERQREGKFLCVGLDPVMSRIEPLWAGSAQSDSSTMRRQFLAAIVRATADLAAAFKPNWAFFLEKESRADLTALIQVIRQEAPRVPIILDWKVGDIDSSNGGYIHTAFDELEVDAMTVHPYIGIGKRVMRRTIESGLKSLFFLCRTSNPEAADLQDKKIVVTLAEVMELTGLSEIQLNQMYGWSAVHRQIEMSVYEYVALKVVALTNRNCGLVVGATAPRQLSRVRQLAPDMPILIPGVGEQGGNIKEVVSAVRDNFLINSSSSILYAFEKRSGDFAKAAQAEAQDLHDQITRCREGVKI